jgi:hypothetical protein
MAEAKEYEMEFKFPDEKEDAAAQQKDDAESDSEVESKGKPEVDIEIVDDTPEYDRGREPLPSDVVENLEKDELAEYDEATRVKFNKYRKVWHDERRAKEAALREQQEAVELTRKIMEENKRLKATLSEGEKNFVNTYKGAAELEMEMAKRAYKEAYEAGDSDKVVEAQQKLAEANYKLQQVNNYRPSLQQSEIDVNSELPQVAVPRPDQKTVAWQERNQWFGTDEEMTSLALGLHQKLEKQYGKQYVGTDEYWQTVDKTIRKRFPEYFGEDEKPANGAHKPAARESKPANVVAPASRSTSSKRIVLKQSEISLAKKFGLTPEQYAKEKLRLENQNG